MGVPYMLQAGDRALPANFPRSPWNNFSEPVPRLFSFSPLVWCQSSIKQETTHFISLTHHDGLVLQPWLILRTSISQAESLNVPWLEELLIWCRWTAQEELIHSLQHFLFLLLSLATIQCSLSQSLLSSTNFDSGLWNTFYFYTIFPLQALSSCCIAPFHFRWIVY